MKKQFFTSVDAKQSFSEVEHKMLNFWESENIFKKSLANRKDKPKYVFFDGPPFANGLPHYGHILANALKDAVTRYWTMRGYYVPRVNGWDCHGLPVEYEIEKELKLTGRKDIEKMGVSKFNDVCRESVFRHTNEWEKLLKRIARWVDFDHSYATLDNNYMESIWWVFKSIWEKGMVYQGHKCMHICPRCETPLSNFEVTLGYKDVVDMSITMKYELVDEPNTFFVAWTTTPWSCLSVTGLAIGPDHEYSKVKMEDGTQYYCASARVAATFDGLGNYEIVKKVKGKDIAYKAYKHLFDFYNNAPEVKESKNAFHTVPTDYVSIEDGTGIVTINGAFGEIDFEAAASHKIPIFVNVATNGTFTKETGAYFGMPVKKAERLIADDLKARGLLLRKDPVKHSYPHCWRCDTPLLNYAAKAWFIRVTDIKDKLLKNNKKIHWVPDHIQEGRFGKWLEGARDWNISRNRFWGCPIPIWECACGNRKCIGSVKELRESSVGGNTVYICRHGESEHNLDSLINSDLSKVYHLTKTGQEQAKKAAEKLKGEGIDVIFCSQFPRAIETAEIFAKILNLPIKKDDHLGEHKMGDFNGKKESEYVGSFSNLQERYTRKIKGGESFEEMESRATDCLNSLNKAHNGKNILIITHGDVVRAAARYYDRLPVEEIFKFKPAHADVHKYRTGKLPLRGDELDLHKPYIDDIELVCEKCGKTMKRIPEVLDCWFESGSMPYAQLHYPFENKKEFEDNFPAHFIAEGLDQTRGWFYTLHVLATILFDKPAFKNVIVNGILLAADGEKLSKRKKNYPDPNELFEKLGMDSMRFFLYSSPAPLAEDVRFSEKHVDEIVKKFTLTLWNTYSFFVTYANVDGWKPEARNPKHSRSAGQNKLDEWILSELNVLIEEVTKNMEDYNLTKATRPLMAFVDNLSNWYVRRSRRRFWKSESDSDKASAYQMLHTVLTVMCKLLAPFMPATSEAIYKNLTGKTSVHLEDWPIADKKLIKKGLNEEIHAVRTIVSLALSLRSKNNIKVRQPLSRILLALPKKFPQKLVEAYRDVILEELNVKDISFEQEGKIATIAITVDPRKIGPRFGAETQKIIGFSKAGNFVMEGDGSVHMPKSGKTQYELTADEVSIGYKGQEGFDVASENGILVSLETKITPELLEEGYVRDAVRFLQELRKKAGYSISDRIYVYVSGPKEIMDAVTRFTDFIERETLAIGVQEGGDFEWDAEEELEIDGKKVKLGVRK